MSDAAQTRELAREDLKHRAIRSFVVRAGRMTAKQTRGLNDGMAQHGVSYAASMVDLAHTFGRTAPTVLEIGFGMGVTTADIAAAQPENNFIAVEVHPPGVGNLCNLLDEQALTNVRVIDHDAVDVLTHMIAPGSLAGVHIYFPDPWHKARHNNRRLVKPPLVALIASRLAVGGYLHLATDWVPYAEQMLEVLSAAPLLANTAEGYAERPAWRPETKFERRGIKLGHEVRDVLFRHL